MYKRYVEKRNGENVIPLRNTICGIDMPKWELRTANDNEMFLSGEAVDKLAELEDKLENGTLRFLPCKVGDTVWYIKNYGFGRYIVEDMEVVGFNFSKYEDAIWVVGKYEEQTSHIYKTEAEAKKKLKELKESENE